MKVMFFGFEFVYIDVEFMFDNYIFGGLVFFVVYFSLGSLYLVYQGVDCKDFCLFLFCEEYIWSKLLFLFNGEIDLVNEYVMLYEQIGVEVVCYFFFFIGGWSYCQWIGIIVDYGIQDVQWMYNFFGNDWFGWMFFLVLKRIFYDLVMLEDIVYVEDDYFFNGLWLFEKYIEWVYYVLYDVCWDREVYEFLLEYFWVVCVVCGVELLED